MASLHEIQQMAEQKAGGSASLLPAWRDALQPLRHFSHPDLSRLLMAMDSPHHARTVLQLLMDTDNPAERCEDWFTGIRESEESLQSWAAAIEVFLSHLHGRSALPAWKDLLGYLDCCLHVCHGQGGTGNFPDTVALMLDSYGFAGGTGN